MALETRPSLLFLFGSPALLCGHPSLTSGLFSFFRGRCPPFSVGRFAWHLLPGMCYLSEPRDRRRALLRTPSPSGRSALGAQRPPAAEPESACSHTPLQPDGPASVGRRVYCTDALRPRSGLGLVFLIAFLDLAGFSILFPLFPHLLEAFGSS